jgi:hypothetical protein
MVRISKSLSLSRSKIHVPIPTQASASGPSGSRLAPDRVLHLMADLSSYLTRGRYHFVDLVDTPT